MKLGAYGIHPWLVTVQEYPDRTARILDHFAKVGLEGVRQFNGINANLSGVRTTHLYEFDNPCIGWVIGFKETATWLSFYMLWSALVHQPTTHTHFLTLEWDAHFAPDWRARTEAALAVVPPDFDLLLLGSCCCEGRPQVNVAGEVWSVAGPLCGHATIVAAKALPVMLSTLRKVSAPLDIALAHYVMPLLKVYTVLPRVADQFDTFLPP